ncbi:MAG: TatD family hydrolase [Candidatus Babeliales bacterium]
MLIDTHCHINIMIKKDFDVPLKPDDFTGAATIVKQAAHEHVNRIINVGTSVIESLNCIALARTFQDCYAAIGIHPNDLTKGWQKDMAALQKLLVDKERNKIIAIGEIGFDKHYPDFSIQQQKDAFKAQVELALTHNLPIIIHTRDAVQETVYALEEYKKEKNFRGVIHCFSEDQQFADYVIDIGFYVGIGGTLTYPKNEALREIFKKIKLEHIVLETDAPFLPPQIIRGKRNHPQYIKAIAEFLAELRATDFETIAQQTTTNAQKLFSIS